MSDLREANWRDIETEFAKLGCENRRLREFAELVMDGVWNGMSDDGHIQDEAERLGLIEERDVPREEDEFGTGKLFFLVWK